MMFGKSHHFGNVSIRKYIGLIALINLLLILPQNQFLVEGNIWQIPTNIATKVQQSARQRWENLSTLASAKNYYRSELIKYQSLNKKKSSWLLENEKHRVEAFQRVFRRGLKENYDDDEYSVWEEEDLEEEEYKPIQKPERSALKRTSSRSDEKISNKHKNDEGEHPMRTDEWLLKIHLSPFVASSEAFLFPQCSSSIRRTNVLKRKPQQILKFSKNGYVLLMEDDTSSNNSTDTIAYPFRRKTKVGKWHLGSSGISFQIPIIIPSPNINSESETNNITSIQSVSTDSQINVKPSLANEISKLKHNEESNNKGHISNLSEFDLWDDDDDDDEESFSKNMRKDSELQNSNKKITMLHYHADIHLHKFGESPRMYRGVVTRDRFHGNYRSKLALPTHWFRPVIATFTAEGIGQDTIDTKYKDRGFGVKSKPSQASRQ